MNAHIVLYAFKDMLMKFILTVWKENDQLFSKI